MAEPEVNPFASYIGSDGRPLPAAAPTDIPEEQNPFAQYVEPEEDTLLAGENSPGWVDRQTDNFQSTATSIVDQMMPEYKDGPIQKDPNNPYADLQSGGLVGDIDRIAKAGVEMIGADIVPAVSNFVIDSGFTLAKQLIPDSWEDSIVNYSKAAWDSLAKNPNVAKGIELAEQGMEVYGEWAQENPDDARQLEAAVNISSLGKPKSAAISKKLKKDIKLADKSNRRAQVRDIMEPIGKKGDGTIKTNKWGTKEYQPSKWELEVHEEVVRTPGVKGGAPYTDNMNAVRDRALYYKDELEGFISKKGNPEINRKSLNAKLANAVNNIDEETLLVGNARDQAIKIYNKAQKLLDAGDGTAAATLKARRDLDSWILSVKNNVFDSDMESAIGVAAKEVRKVMNESVGDAVGSARVKTLLDRQHKLLTAGDMMEAKAYREADGIIGRIIQKGEQKTGGKLPTTPVAQGALAAGAFATAPIWGPALALVGSYKGLKWLATGPGRKWMAAMAAAAEKNPLLRPDVLALQNLAGGLTPEEAE